MRGSSGSPGWWRERAAGALRARRRAGGWVLAALLAVAGAPAAGQEGATDPTGEALETAAVVLVYHRFGESDFPETNVTLEQFEAHLGILERGGYAVLPLPEIVDALATGAPLPARTVGISIDDAYRSVWTEAWPRLRAANLPFTLFVSTDAVDRESPRVMTWAQLRELAASPLVTIGSQTASHPHMPEQTPERNRQELARANARFARELGEAPALFAYPFGEYSLAVRALVREAGYAGAFGQQSGAIGPTSDRYALPRFALNESYGSAERFRLVVDTLPLPALDVTPQDPALAPENNPPAYGFTVPPAAGALEGLNCYAGRNAQARVQRLDRRIEVRFATPLPPGRTRVNCTMPGPRGPEGEPRWRWHGRQFFVPEGDG